MTVEVSRPRPEQFAISPKLPYQEVAACVARREIGPITTAIVENANELFAQNAQKRGIDVVIGVVLEHPDRLSAAANQIAQTALAIGVGLDDPHIVFLSGKCFYDLVATTREEASAKLKKEDSEVTRLLAKTQESMAGTLREYARVSDIPVNTDSLLVDDNTRLSGNLTQKQMELLSLVAEGLSNKEISQRIGLAPSTVKNMLTAVFAKLNLHNRTKVAVLAKTSGVV